MGLNCPYTYSDCLWYVAEVMKPPKRVEAFKSHLSDCPSCQDTTKAMKGWAEEDREVYEHVMKLPFPMLKSELEQSFTDDNALAASPIVARLIQEALGGNKSALPLLQMAAEQAPGLAGMHARTYLETIADKGGK